MSGLPIKPEPLWRTPRMFGGIPHKFVCRLFPAFHRDQVLQKITHQLVERSPVLNRVFTGPLDGFFICRKSEIHASWKALLTTIYYTYVQYVSIAIHFKIYL